MTDQAPHPLEEPYHFKHVRDEAYQLAESGTAFFAQRAAKAALTFGAALAREVPDAERTEAEAALRKAASSYFEAFRLHYVARTEAQGVPPNPPPKTCGQDDRMAD